MSPTTTSKTFTGCSGLYSPASVAPSLSYPSSFPPASLAPSALTFPLAAAAMYGACHRKLGEARDDAGRLLSLVEMDRQAETVAAELTVQHRKQLELTRAIATGARVLLLDEVFAGLSGDELVRSINLVSKIQKELGFGALVVEHVMRAVLTLSGHVVVIEEGRTIAEGAPQEVVHDPAVIEAYLGTEVARAPT